MTPFQGLWGLGSLGRALCRLGDQQGPSGPDCTTNMGAEWANPSLNTAAGVKNADETELRLLASQPLDITVHNVQDFPQLSTLSGLLSRLICQKVQGRSPRGSPGERRGWGRGRVATPGAAPPGPLPLGSQGSQDNWGAPVLPGSGRQGAQAEPLTPASPWAWAPLPPTATPALDPPPAPTRLVLTQVTSSSVLLSWSPAPQPPLKYLIVWRPSKGGTPREVSTGPPAPPPQAGLE